MSQTMIDFVHLWTMVANIHLSHQPDKTHRLWTPNGEYTVKSPYTMLHNG
jgi:hypothetical protein